MKRSLVGILLLVLLLFTVPTTTNAAYMADDQGVTGKLTLDPEDAAAGKNVVLRLQFSSQNNSFQLLHCACELTITQPNRLPYQQKIQVVNAFAPNTTEHTNQALNTVGLTYKFPTEGNYTITVAGKPMEGQTFKSFTLKWDVHVKGTAETAPPTLQKSKAITDHKVMLGSILMIGIIIIYFLVSHLQRKKKQNKQ